jgi:hypothetical protein
MKAFALLASPSGCYGPADSPPALPSPSPRCPWLRCRYSCAEEQCARHGIVNLEVRHVCGDPRSRGDMERLLNISLFKGAIVVCGERQGPRLRL